MAGRETDLCRVSVQRSVACSSPTESEEALLARCRADLGDYPNRAAPCFVAELGECLMKCGSDDKCYSDALVANDPSIVDLDRYRACTESSATGCDDDEAAVGFLKACFARADECSAFEDLCSSIVAMKQPFRGQGEACIERSCAELEGCLYAAMGRDPS